jgi:hypothetical protein
MNVGHFRLYDLVDVTTRKELAAYYGEDWSCSLQAAQTNPYQIGVPFIWCSKQHDSRAGDASYSLRPYDRRSELSPVYREAGRLVGRR